MFEKRMMASMLMVILSTIILSAQQNSGGTGSIHRLSGDVVDSRNGSPLQDAVVAAPQAQRSTRTDSSGKFSFENLPVTPTFLIVTREGYLFQRVSLQSRDTAATLTVSLVSSVNTPVKAEDSSAAATPETPPLQTPPVARPPVTETLKTISGKVVDARTGRPLTGAIAAIGAAQSASDETGSFTLAAPATDSMVLTVFARDYETSTVKLSRSSRTDGIEVKLSPSSVFDLQDMDVNAQKEKIDNLMESSNKISQLTIKPELMAKLPSIGEQDVFRSLQLMPGVSGTNEGSSGLYVRGGTPDENLVLLNDIPIYYVDHFYGFFSAFNPTVISDVTLNKGGFSAEYGGKLSSVVQLQTKGAEPVSDSTRGFDIEGGLGLLSANAYVQAPLVNNDIGTVIIAARRSLTDVVKTNLFENIFQSQHGNDTLFIPGVGIGATNKSLAYQPVYYFYDINGIARINLGKTGSLTTTVFTSYDDQDNSLDTSWTSVTNSTNITRNRTTLAVDTVRDTTTTHYALNNDDVTKWGNMAIGENWDQKWTDKISTKITYSYSDFTDTRNELDSTGVQSTSTAASAFTRPDTGAAATRAAAAAAPGTTNSNNEIRDMTLRFSNTLKLADWSTLVSGLEGSQPMALYTDVTTGNTGTTGVTAGGQNQNIKALDTSLTAAGFIEDEMNSGNNLSFTPGIRISWFKLAHSYSIDPRLSGWWKPDDRFKLQAAWGLYSQDIHSVVDDDILGGSKDVWLLANSTDRPVEKAQHIIAGASWENPSFLVDVEGYVKYLDGLLEMSELTAATTGNRANDPDDLPIYSGKGLAKGIELLVQAKSLQFNLFNCKAIYDAWVSYTLSSVTNTFSVFNNGNPFPANQDRPNEAKIVNSLTWKANSWSDINLSADWLYSTGTPYTEPFGFYTLTTLAGVTDTFTHVSAKNAYRLPDFHRLDCSLGWKIHLNDRFECNITGGIFNVYNHENILERQFEELGNAFVPQDTKSLPFTPNIEVSASMKL